MKTPGKRRKRFQRAGPSGRRREKATQKKFASSLGWINGIYGEKLAQRMASLTPKLGLFLIVNKFPGDGLVVTMAGKSSDYHISIETDSVIAEKVGHEGRELTKRDLAQMIHRMDQAGKKRLVRRLAEKAKKAPLWKTTAREYPFQRGNPAGIKNALGFAITETLDEIEADLKN